MTDVDVESAVNAAGAAAGECADEFRRSAPARRAALLDRIADEIEQLGDGLLDTLEAETSLPRARLQGERGRTTGQLRLFGDLLRRGAASDVRIDGTGKDAGIELRSLLVAIGPVAVFGASNFPLAFSTAGGDTASALAAGCPVVVKAHPAHVRSSTLVAEAINHAVAAEGLPAGVFSHVVGDVQIGLALVMHSAIRAVGFTGSRHGGMALAAAAASRRVPIPVFAEMSSVNPVFVLPGAADAQLADGFVASMTLGSGQFCTNPGLVFLPRSDRGDAFVDAARERVDESVGHTMLTTTIATAFRQATEALGGRPDVDRVAAGDDGDLADAPGPALFETDFEAFAADPLGLQHELFGAASLIVRYSTIDELIDAAELLEGQLTATIHHSPEDESMVLALLPVLERVAGRLVSNGWPTGVEVTSAMTHGGAFPATTDARFTSVGTRAIARFLRPVTYQAFPDALLPEALQATNPLALWRSLDGEQATR